MGKGVTGSEERDPASECRGGRRGRKATVMGPGQGGLGVKGEGEGKMAGSQGYVPAPGYDVKGVMIAEARVMLRTSKIGKKTRDSNVPENNMSAYPMYQNIMR